MTINNKTLATLQGLVTSTTTNEGNFRTGMNDVLAQVNANQEDLAIAVNNPQAITTLTSGSTYAIPSNALAIYIRAAGGGKGGTNYFRTEDENNTYWNASGGASGGDTTVSNTALSLSITSKGGGQSGSSSGGHVKRDRGSAGGTSVTSGSIPNGWFPPSSEAESGDLVTTYINSSSVAGKALSYSIGSGGAGNSQNSVTGESGDTGYLEIWVW